MSGWRRLWWLWVPLGALVLIAVAWLAWYGVALWQLNRIKEEISAAGFPSAVAEVIPENIPDSQNAADLLLRVQEIWNKVKDSKGFIKASAGAKDAERDPLLFDAAKLEQLQAQMQRPDMQELFRLMGEAAWMPVAHFDRDYSKGAMIELGPIASMLAGGQQVTATAWLAARQGKQKVAADDLLTLSRLASFGLRDVLLIGWLVGVAIDQLSVGSAQLVLGALPAGSFKMEEWKPLDELWAVHAKEARGDLVRVLEAERLLFGNWLFQGAMAGRISLGEMVVQVLPVKDPEAAARWRTTMSLYETVFAPLLVNDYAAYLTHMLAVREAVKNGTIGNAGGEEFAKRVPKLACLTRLAAPAYDGIPKKLAEYEVNLQLGRLGLVLENFRSREGKYPATLQELGLPDSAITDPCTGQLFIYRPDGDSVLVYSVGIDRSDDGGISAPLTKPHDIAWRIEREKDKP